MIVTTTRALRFIAPALLWLAAAGVRADDVLIADRLSNCIYRYSASGQFENVLISDPNSVYLNGPTGVTLSPDYTKLYVSSSNNNQVVAYDYNASAGTASNPQIFAGGSQGINYPSSIAFNAAGNRIYVSNLTSGAGVVQLNLNGTVAAPPLVGKTQPSESLKQYSGLTLAPDGSLLVGGFQNTTQNAGGILKTDPAITTLTDLVSSTTKLNGAGALAVHGNDVYVTSLFAGQLNAYNVWTGAIDPAFAPVNGLAFPESISVAPDGNSLLVGILGFVAGQGKIARYSFTGSLLGTFATPQTDPTKGFEEATSIAVIPSPKVATVPPGSPITTTGRDGAVATMTNAPSARSGFLATLSTSATDNLESYPIGNNPTLSFPSAGGGVTATTDFDGVVDATGATTSGHLALQAKATSLSSATRSITFNKPITAFGAYILEAGDGNANQLTLELNNSLTGTTKDVVLGTLGPGAGANNVAFFSVIDSMAFDKIRLIESSSTDALLLDDITAGYEYLQNLSVPAGATITLAPSSSGGSFLTSAQLTAVPEPAAMVHATIAVISMVLANCTLSHRGLK